MTKPAPQHRTPKDPIFTSVAISGKSKTGQTTPANPSYSAELVKPSAPKSEPRFSSPTTAGLKPVPTATK